MGVGPGYQAARAERIRNGTYHTSADPYWVPPEPEVKTIIKTVIEKLPNPVPTNYRIKNATQVGIYLVVEINYPDCTNYEGDKILVYENCTLLELVKQHEIDPHFSEDSMKHSPVARFKPMSNGYGMRMGVVFAEAMNKEKHK